MEIRKILVPLNGQHEPGDPDSLDASALQTALSLSSRLNAEIEVLSVVSPPTQESLSLISWMPDYGMDRVLEDLESQRDTRQRNARASYETYVAPKVKIDGLRATFVEKQGDIRLAVGAAGRLSDMMVVASSDARWEQPFRPILDAALHETARPIFVAPVAPPDSVGEHVTIAWNDSPESARALACAIPLLRAATSVSVLVCRESSKTKNPHPLEAVIDYLSLHGVTAEGTEIIAQHARPAREIIEAALAQGSDLLILGSVIHSRAYSLIYGSLTEEVLKSPRLSAFLVS